MTAAKIHKFDEKLDITYSQYITDTMAGEVALQKELVRVLGKEKGHAILRNWAEKRSVELVTEFLKNSDVEIRNFEDFIRYMDKMWVSESTIRTHTCTKIRSDSKRVSYEVTECIWAKMMRALDASELGQLTMCDIDFITASVYHPNIKLIREKTLMNGDDCCDFTYVWEKK